MSRIGKNYLINSGTVLPYFESLTGWIVGSGNVIVNSDDTKFGTNSFFYTGVAGAAALITRTVNLNLNSIDLFGIWTRIQNYLNTPYIWIMFSSTGDFSGGGKYVYKAFTTSEYKTGTNLLTVRKDEWISVGEELLSNTMTHMRIRLGSGVGVQSQVRFSNPVYNWKAKAKAVFIWDDGNISQYTVAHPILAAKGWVGNIAVVGSWINLTNYMTLAQLTELKNAGYGVINHTYNHLNLANTFGSSISGMVNEVKQNDDWMVQNGFTRERTFFVFPQGGWNDAGLQTMQLMNFTIARAGLNGVQPHAFGIDQPFLVKQFELKNTNTLAQAKDAVDKAILEGGTLFITGHIFSTPASQVISWPIEDFQALVDYLYEKRNDIDCGLNIRDWYGGLTSGSYSKKRPLIARDVKFK